MHAGRYPHLLEPSIMHRCRCNRTRMRQCTTNSQQSSRRMGTGSSSPEIPGANGQGRTKQECLESLAAAISLVLEDRREDGLRGVPAEVERAVVVVESSPVGCQIVRPVAVS